MSYITCEYSAEWLVMLLFVHNPHDLRTGWHDGRRRLTRIQCRPYCWCRSTPSNLDCSWTFVWNRTKNDNVMSQHGRGVAHVFDNYVLEAEIQLIRSRNVCFESFAKYTVKYRCWEIKVYHNFCIKLRKTKTNLKKSNFNIINIKKFILTTAESTFLRKFIRKNLVTNYYLLVQALKITFHIFDAKKS